MSIIIGRAGLDATAGVLRFNKVRWDGDEVDLSGWVRDAASTAEMRAVRDQIRGLADNPDFPVVPVTFSEDPTLDGFYRVTGATVDSTPTLQSGVRALPFDVGLRRVRSAGSPVHESRLLHALRSGSAVTSASSDPLVGVPPDTTVYRRGSVGLGGLNSRNVSNIDGSASAGSVLVDVWAGNESQADAEWQAAPGTFMESACLVSQSIGGASYRAFTNRQIPSDVSPNTEWALANGLVVVLPSAALGGTAGTISVLSWAGAALESATELSLEMHDSVTTYSFTGVTVLRNSPEACTIRLNVATAAGGPYGTVDLTVRRGDRNLHGVLRRFASGVVEVHAPGAATAITGAVRLTSNDADGNRWVLSSSLGAFSAGADGAVDVSGTLLDFGFGVEIGGSGSSGIDTAQSLANQYAAAVGEHVSIVNP